MERDTVRTVLALHLAALVQHNKDRWPATPPSQVLEALRNEDDTVLEHLNAMEHLYRR